LQNPASALTFTTGIRPTVVITASFNGDPHLDLAILNEGSSDLSIFLGDGRGGFRAVQRLSAGNMPTGLSAHDVNGDGQLDLLVGNDFGDVLTLPGNGDGTFEPYQRASRNIALAMLDLNGDGHEDFLFGNESMDRVSVQYSQGSEPFTQGRGDGVLAPGAVAGADLNADGMADLVVANSGANNILVYLGTGGGQFGPASSFFAGTNPAGVTIQDLNGDRLPDLVVANEGSNDVTLLLGQRTSANWTLAPGPRLQAGTGPVSTAVADVTGDAIPDILVSNSQSNNVFLLPGVGGGFFDDRNPFVRSVGSDPGQIISVGAGIITLNRGSNDLTFIPNIFQPQRLDISSGGLRPVAAVMGDFSGDGRSDLFVANNGNGVVSLLLGDVSGFILAQTFLHADVRHPSALAVLAGGSGVEVYVTDEGHESAILLTSFGIPVPGGGGEEPLQEPTDVIFVAGPGFLFPENIFTTGETESFDAEQLQALPLEQFAALAFASLLFGDSEVLFSTHLDGSTEGETEAEADPEAAAASDRIGFLIGVDEALRDALAEAEYQTTVDAVMATIDQVLNEWLPSLLADVKSIDFSQWLALAKLTGVGDEILTSLMLLQESMPQVVDTIYEFVEELLPADRDAPAAATAVEQYAASVDVVMAAIDELFTGWLPTLVIDVVGKLLSIDPAADRMAPEEATHDRSPKELLHGQSLFDETARHTRYADLWLAVLYASHRFQAPRPVRMEETRTQRARFPRPLRRCS
jgi:hypothetical protein